MRRALLAAAAGLALAACRPPPAGSELFPLEAGHVWTYQVSIEREGGRVERGTQVLRTLGAESLDGAPAWRRRSDSGVDYWLRADASGIYRVASKSDLDAEAQPDKERRYVLKAPFAEGTSWQATTTAYLLQRRQEFPRELRHSHPAIPMSYRIDALDQAVRTAAGDFRGCVRVEGKALLMLFADPVAGWTNIPLTTSEWYCPGVGLVRLEREEPAASAFLDGGRLTMELTSWR